MFKGKIDERINWQKHGHETEVYSTTMNREHHCNNAVNCMDTKKEIQKKR
jgi:hypothetical protein